MPPCPVNHRMPPGSNTAVLRFAPDRGGGSGNLRTSRVAASTRTMAFRPESVTHAAPSGPTITPWGAEPGGTGKLSGDPEGDCDPARVAALAGWPGVVSSPPQAMSATARTNAASQHARRRSSGRAAHDRVPLMLLDGLEPVPLEQC